MNRLELLGNEVRKLTDELDAEIASFQSWSSLGCVYGCGQCCLKPDIEAVPLEFLPLALELYQKGEAEHWMNLLENAGDVCAVYDEGQAGAGKCSRYLSRGLICRLFGYSARRNKYGHKELLTCQLIKTGQQEAYTVASEKILSDGQIPVAADFYARLRALDPVLGGETLPINQAIKNALMAVLRFNMYDSNV